MYMYLEVTVLVVSPVTTYMYVYIATFKLYMYMYHSKMYIIIIIHVWPPIIFTLALVLKFCHVPVAPYANTVQLYPEITLPITSLVPTVEL